MKFFRLILPVLAAALLLASCGAKLPQAEVDAANAAFAEAKAAQADVLAADAFKAANDANDALQNNLTAKAYGKTKALAKTLLDASTAAKSAADTELENAKTEVAQLDSDISAELPVIQKSLNAAVAKKDKKVDVKAIKAALAAAPKTLSDSQANADVVAARTDLRALKDSLDGFKAALEDAGFKN